MKAQDWIVCLALAAAVAVAYWPVTHYGFVHYDDHRYVFENCYVRDGFSPEGVAQAFAGTTQGNWHPVTNLSHMLDCELFGLAAPWHHVTNLLLHMANSILVFLVFQRMTAARWPSALAAGLFALHPLHVESVAWIAERKDVLSTFFFLLTLGAYHAYTLRPGAARYVPVMLLMALGLMAKPMLVTLPFVLMLLDLWPLGRWQRAWAAKGIGPFSGEPQSPGRETSTENMDLPPLSARRRRNVTRLVLEKVPLLALSAVSSLITYRVQQQEGAMGMLGGVPLTERICNILTAYLGYLDKTIWPGRLAVIYPYVVRQPKTQILLAAGMLVVATYFVVRFARQRPYLFTGWFWYLGTLVPVIGLVQVGAQSMADRYTYIPLIGIFVLLSWGAADLTAAWSPGWKTVLGVGLLLACLAGTAQQVTYWSDSETLFRRAATAVPRNFLAHHFLGLALWHKGDRAGAGKEFHAALEIVPKLAPTHDSLGQLLAEQGQPEQAIHEFQESLKILPQQTEAMQHLAWLLATCPDGKCRNGPVAVALAQKATSLTRQPDAALLDALAAALADAGRYDDAVTAARQALKAAESAQQKSLAEAIQNRLELYQSRRPYRQPPR